MQCAHLCSCSVHPLGLSHAHLQLCQPTLTVARGLAQLAGSCHLSYMQTYRHTVLGDTVLEFKIYLLVAGYLLFAGWLSAA